MKTYAVLLRGINVGGKNKVKMSTLRDYLQIETFQDIKTYIQSGNIVLSTEKTKQQVKKTIESILQTHFNVDTFAIVREKHELDDIVNNCPFSDTEIETADMFNESASLYVAFLDQEFDADAVNTISELANNHEKLYFKDNNIYLLFHDSIRNSKLARKIDKLASNVTIRNWKSTSKIYSLM